MRDSGITRIILTAALVSAVACDLRADNPTNFTVHSAVDDSTFELAQHKGKPVVLHFLLKTECPYCMRYTHDYAALAETTPNVVHVFLKPDTAMEIKAWAGKLSKEGLKDLPIIYRDPHAALATQYQIPDGYKFHGQSVHFPTLVALDADGKELFRYVGKSNSDRMKVNEFSEKLDEHLRAKTSK